MQYHIRFILMTLLMMVMGTVYAKTTSQIFSDPTRTIQISADNLQFSIIQPANPTTGYNWKIEFFDSSLLKLIDSKYQPATSHLIGSGGKMIWNFEVLPMALHHPTDTPIKLVYQRNWDPTDNPSHVVFTVKIHS
jgi:inhibitor of cysteine peptidase